MKQFYETLLKTFENNKNEYKKTGLKPFNIIDLYNGQDINPEYFDIIKLPALYVSLEVNYAPDTPILSLDARILFEQLRNSSNIGSPKALGFFDVADLTDKIIKSIQTNATGKIKLLHEAIEPEPTITDVYTLSYQCTYFGKIKTEKPQTLQGQFDDIEIEGNLFTNLL